MIPLYGEGNRGTGWLNDLPMIIGSSPVPGGPETLPSQDPLEELNVSSCASRAVVASGCAGKWVFWFMIRHRGMLHLRQYRSDRTARRYTSILSESSVHSRIQTMLLNYVTYGPNVSTATCVGFPDVQRMFLLLCSYMIFSLSGMHVFSSSRLVYSTAEGPRLKVGAI